MVDFFINNCQSVTSAKEFGLCKNSSRPHVYLDEQNKLTWVATVENDDETEIRFVAVDNCINLNFENGDTAKGCDAILIYPENILFIELNCGSATRNEWITSSVIQIKHTIEIFNISYNIDNYPLRTAYLLEKNKPLFAVPQFNQKDIFANETGIQLLISSNISI